MLNVKIMRLSQMHVHREIMCLKGKATIFGTRLLSVLGRSEHTCGTRAQQEDSVGLEPTASQHLLYLALPLSYLLLLI